MEKNKKIGLLSLFFLLALGFMIYANALTAEFVFDDFSYIQNNPYIRHWADIIGHFREGVPKTRATVLFSFFINYQIHELNPFGYHLTNLLIHLGTTLLLWWLYRMILFSGQALNASVSKSQKKILAFSAALLFLTHPIQTQAVSYISQRFASLATFFYIATLCFYFKGRTAEEGTKTKKKHFLFFSLSLLSAGLALTSKEIAITLPLTVWLLDSFFIQPTAPSPKNKTKNLFLFCVATLLLVALTDYLFPAKIIYFLKTNRLSESHQGDVFSLYTYLLTQSRVWVTFLRLLVCPFPQNVDYDFPMSKSFFEPQTFTAISFLLLLFALAVKIKKKYPLIAFGLFWFYLTLLANAVPRANPIFEHKLYLVSAGFCLGLTAAIFHLCRSVRIFRGVMTGILLLFCVMTFQRNKIWRNNFSLWQDCVKKSPKKKRPNQNLANEYARQGAFAESLTYYNKAIEIKPNDPQILTNRGLALLRLGQADKALEDLNTALGLDPAHHAAYNNRGLLYEEAGQYDLAQQDFSMAIGLKKNFTAAYINRARIYNKTGQLLEALEDLNKAIKADPHSFDAYDTRAIVHVLLHKRVAALDDFDQALRLNPQSEKTYSNRGRFYLLEGEYEKALADLNQAVDLNPRYAPAYLNRGQVYRLTKQTDRAVADLNQLMKLDPHNSDAPLNLGLIYLRKGQSDLALAHFEKALGLATKNKAFITHNLGLAYTQKKDYAAARDSFSLAIQEKPDYVQAYLARALAHQYLGNLLKAEQDRQTAKTLREKGGI